VSPVYLDYNGTTPVAPEVLGAMLPYLREDYGNPSSSHASQKGTEGLKFDQPGLAALSGPGPISSRQRDRRTSRGSRRPPFDTASADRAGTSG
jgi:hypothetical protein